MVTVTKQEDEERSEDAVGEYESFEACVADNQDMDDPEAYCQALAEAEESANEGNEDEAEKGIELTGPIVRKDKMKQIAYAPVLVPGEKDSDGEKVTAEKIEQVAHGWMEQYRNIDLDHTLNNVDAVPVESYLTTADMSVKIEGQNVTIPKGSWILASKFRDPQVWKGIMNGELSGYSVMGVRSSAVKNAAAKSESVAFKRTLLGDLGDDWVATHVSVVTDPAVPKAKWFALKSAAEVEEHPSFAEKVRAAFGLKEGRRFSADRRKKIRTLKEIVDELHAEAEKDAERGGPPEEEEKNGQAAKSAVSEAIREAVKGK